MPLRGFDFSNLAKEKRPGLRVIQADKERLVLQVKNSPQHFIIYGNGREFTLNTYTRGVDSPNAPGSFVMRTDDLRRLLILVGMIDPPRQPIPRRTQAGLFS